MVALISSTSGLEDVASSDPSAVTGFDPDGLSTLQGGEESVLVRGVSAQLCVPFDVVIPVGGQVELKTEEPEDPALVEFEEPTPLTSAGVRLTSSRLAWVASSLRLS
jgi:hypothetical protein